MWYKFFPFLISVFFSALTFGQINNKGEASEAIGDSIETKSNFYVSAQFFNATRQIEDLSSSQRFDSLSFEEPINTQGFEIGTIITLSKRLQLGVGLNLFSGGETWSFADSLSDSSFTYTNKYRQMGVPLRLSLFFGNKLKYYGFLGLIPSTILNRRYESSFTRAEGFEVENDVERTNDDINSFQLIGTAGAGLSYQLGPASIFAQVEIRQHLTNTYTGIFLNHTQRLVGGSVGLTFNF